MKIEKILCPVDFSEFSALAMSTADNLASKFGARLLFIHVVQLPAVPYVDPAVLQQAFDQSRQVMEEKLEEYCKRGVARAEYEQRVVEGNPTSVILDLVREEGIDLVVMGSHGRTGLTHLLLGSVAERVVRHAPCPVLVMKQKSDSK